jgi:hypothetical protein
MNKNVVSVAGRLEFILVTVLAVVIISLANYENAGLAQQQQQQQTFIAKLSGTNEVPPVVTRASGVAKFTASTDGKSLDWVINVTNIRDIMGAHIHSGNLGENGPVVVTLFNPSMTATQNSGIMNGTSFKGTITGSFLEGPLTGSQMSDLIKLVSSKAAYVNIHTQQNQDGEIRGQISSP